MTQAVQNPLSDDLLEVPDFRMVSVQSLIGQGYDEYWWWPGRYDVVMGSMRCGKMYITIVDSNNTLDDAVMKIPSKDIGFIYLYSFDNGLKYVGQTKGQVYKRHMSHKRSNKQVVDRMIRTHEFNLEVICETSWDNLNE